MSIEIRKVTKSFGPVRALIGVSMDVREGETLGVLGANGSGKSTLLALLATLTRPTAGTIEFGSFGQSPEEVRSHLGWVGHDLLCYPDLTGRENIELAAALRGVSANEAFAASQARFGFAAYIERPVRTLSRGQRQRVALARALIHRPKLVLLDEPTTGLDPAGVEQLRTILEEEHAQGTTLVMVTHDVAFAKETCSRSIQLERGRVV